VLRPIKKNERAGPILTCLRAGCVNTL